MARTVEFLEYLKKYPVFDSRILNNKLDKQREYANLFIHRLKNNKNIIKIEKNKYTLYDDPFLIASHLTWPSYISGWSALNFYKLTEQVPHDISVITTKDKKPVRFKSASIIFTKTKSSRFFGYKKIKYGNFEIFIAEPEKAIIDCALLRKVSFSEIREITERNIKELNINRLLAYLKKIKNSSLTKRFGYLLERAGYDCHKRLKSLIDFTYIPLEYSKKCAGKKNKKWRVILND